MTENNQDDLWNAGNTDEGLFGSEELTADIFGDVPADPPVAPAKPAGPKSSSPLPEEGMSLVKPAAPEAKAQSDGYVVLARKYRPQTFDDIVGQEGVQTALRGAIATGQISHSYLFSGPRGTGKTSTARILAKALNCQENGPRPDPCGRCSSCRSITVGSSLDVIEIDAASNTGVDNIRELKSGVVLAPFSRYKVYIVDEVHMLSNQAFNALLKTLEEPPPQVIFILATTELHKVPETIISRCQTFIFRRFSLEELKNQLGSIMDIEAGNRGLTVSSEDREKILDLIARNAEGGMRDAQVTLDQVLVLSKGVIDFESVRRFLGMADTEALDLFVRLINEKKSRELLELIDQLVTSGQDLELFVKGACEHMRDLLLIKCAGRDTTMINVSEDRATDLEAIAASLPAPFLVSAIDQFLKVVGEMKVSGQPRIVLELAVLKLTLPDPNRDIESILKRLDALEAGVNSVAAPAPSTVPVKPSAVVNTHSKFQAEPGLSASPVPSGQQPVPNPEPSDMQVGELAPEYSTEQIAPATVSPSVREGLTPEQIVDGLRRQLRVDAEMLYNSFEKASTGHDLDGRVLTFFLNPVQKFSFSQLTRPQNIDTLNRIVREMLGETVVLRIQEKEDPGTSPQASGVVEETSFAPPQKPTVASERPVQNRITTTAPPAKVAALDDLEDGPLKIYYPDEIRDKTMLEIKDSEFQELLSADSALRSLVEKTKQVFGVDDKCVKFHRSTLA